MQGCLLTFVRGKMSKDVCPPFAGLGCFCLLCSLLCGSGSLPLLLLLLLLPPLLLPLLCQIRVGMLTVGTRGRVRSRCLFFLNSHSKSKQTCVLWGVVLQVMKKKEEEEREEEKEEARERITKQFSQGVCTALGLIERGKRVVVVERGRIGWAASGRNGGFALPGYQIDGAELIERSVCLSRLCLCLCVSVWWEWDRLGAEKARHFYQLSLEGFHVLRQRIDKYRILCDVKVTFLYRFLFFFLSNICGRLVCRMLGSWSCRASRTLRRSTQITWGRQMISLALNLNCGMVSLSSFLTHCLFTDPFSHFFSLFLIAAKVQSFYRTTFYHHGVFSPDAFTVNPLGMTAGLARAARTLGALMFERTNAVQIEEVPASSSPSRRYRVTTSSSSGEGTVLGMWNVWIILSFPSDCSLTADHVVLATNYDPGNQTLSKLVARGTVPIYTYIAVTKPLPVGSVSPSPAQMAPPDEGIEGELGKIVKKWYCTCDDRFALAYFRPLPGELKSHRFLCIQ